MNRRDFTKSLAAAIVAPVIPAKALFAAAPAAHATSGAAYNLYTWGKMLTQVHGKCSAEMLGSMLNLDTTAARALHQTLLAEGVAAPANALGVSRATNPMRGPLSGAAAQPTAPQLTPDSNLLAKTDCPDTAPLSDDSSNINDEAQDWPHDSDVAVPNENGSEIRRREA